MNALRFAAALTLAATPAAAASTAVSRRKSEGAGEVVSIMVFAWEVSVRVVRAVWAYDQRPQRVRLLPTPRAPARSR